MSNELQTTLDNILNDKNTNLLPENLKAGVTCLGVDGQFNGILSRVQSNLVKIDYSAYDDADRYMETWIPTDFTTWFCLPYDISTKWYICGISDLGDNTYSRWFIVLNKNIYGIMDIFTDSSAPCDYGIRIPKDYVEKCFKFNNITSSELQNNYGYNELGAECTLEDLKHFLDYGIYIITMGPITSTDCYVGNNLTEKYHTPFKDISIVTDMLRSRNVLNGTSVYTNSGEHQVGTLQIPSNVLRMDGVQLSLENTVDYRTLNRDTNFIFYITDEIKWKKYYILYEEPKEIMHGEVDHQTYLITSDEPLFIKSHDYYHGYTGSSTNEHWMQIFQTVDAEVDMYLCKIDTDSEGLEDRTFITIFTSDDIDYSIIGLSNFTDCGQGTSSSDGHLRDIHVSGGGVVESNARLITNCAITKLDDPNIVILNELKDGLDTSDATATAGDIIQDLTAYVNDEKITGTLITKEGYTEEEVSSIYSSDNGIIVRNSTSEPICLKPNAGFLVANDTTASAIRLTPEILKKGETVLGMTGTLEIGVDTTDSNATADDIAETKTAYVKGVKLVGTIPEIKSEETTSSTQITYSNGIKITADSKVILDEGASILVDSETCSTNLGITSDKILYGKSICGISGQATFIESDYAVQANILSGKKAYVNGKLITGSATTSYSAISSKDKIIVNDSTFEVKPFTKATFIESSDKTITVSNSALADAIELTPEIIQKDVKVLGVTGTYVGEAGTGTEDATAEAKDIVTGKTAYINKVKVTGTLPVKENTTIKSSSGTLTKITNTNGTATYQVTIPDLKTYTDGVMLKNTDITLALSESTLANVIGLTSDMIAEGTIVLGIAGTHAGNGMLTEDEYNEIEAIADNILAISTQTAEETAEEINEIENNGGEA